MTVSGETQHVSSAKIIIVNKANSAINLANGAHRISLNVAYKYGSKLSSQPHQHHLNGGVMAYLWRQ